MEKDSKDWQEACLNRHLSEVNKLNDMTFKVAEDYCKKFAKEKGSIAAREIWKSTEHYAKELKRKKDEANGKSRNSKW